MDTVGEVICKSPLGVKGLMQVPQKRDVLKKRLEMLFHTIIDLFNVKISVKNYKR